MPQGCPDVLQRDPKVPQGGLELAPKMAKRLCYIIAYQDVNFILNTHLSNMYARI